MLVFVAHVHDMLVVLTSVFGIVSLVLAPMAAAVAYDYCEIVIILMFVF